MPVMPALPDPAYEAEYNLRARHADSDTLVARWTGESERVRRTLPCLLDQRYGDEPNATLDLFPARTAGAPILVFIHGGYWRRLDKADHSFIAEAPVANGAAVAVLNYDLCPAVTIETIVAECRAATAWVYRNAAKLNGDPARLYVTGHSAGGHLTATTLATDWQALGLPADLIKGGLPLSGVFDLHPIILTSINDDTRLNRETAERLSPLYRKPHHLPPIVAAVGAGETFAFLEQTRLYADAWRRWGGEATHLVVPGVHHFDVLLELARADSRLGRSLFTLMSL
ncbi:MAG: alpha/beta hydrolase [Alphaproteobacteria bacterium]